jgi:hypothetical protein
MRKCKGNRAQKKAQKMGPKVSKEEAIRRDVRR